MTTKEQVSAGGTPTETSTQEILDFLTTAPAQLQPWAQSTAAQISAEAEPRDDDSGEPAPPSEPVGASVTTPRDLRTTVPATRTKRAGWHPSTVILATLLTAGLVFGIYFIGRPAPDEAATPDTQAAQGINDADQARMAELEQILGEDPEDIPAHLELGVLLFNIGDDERAEHHWLRVTMIDPENAQAWFNLGFLYLSRDEPDREAAQAAWDQVLEVAPGSDLAQVVQSHMDTMLRDSGATQTEQDR